jgi:hypothetical protein
MEKRYNIEDGCFEIKIQPEGLPAIWLDEDSKLCERCEPFGECLGLETAEDQIWDEEKKKVKASIDKHFCNN